MARSCTTCEHIKRAEIDRRLKAAETDATKRALATFGKPFGLELYRKDALPCRPMAQPLSARAMGRGRAAGRPRVTFTAARSKPTTHRPAQAASTARRG
ncbi:MAG: Rad52/Rad22 family DNA repair protein [Pseudolabrys sp.]